MSVLRSVRRRVVGAVSRGAVRCAPWLSRSAIEGLDRTLTRAGPHVPIISRLVAENMRSAGLYSHETHREYFRQVAGQLSGWLHVYRQPDPGSGPGGLSPELRQIVERRVHLDDSVEGLKQAAKAGRGVILMAMHLADVPMWLGRINQVVPTSVYARYAKDPRRHAVKQQWWRVTGLGWISEPSGDRVRGGRLAKMVDVLQAGRTVVITPDLARKQGEGTPVRFLDRCICLPSGAAVLSVLTGAPLMMLGARAAGSGPRGLRANCLTFRGPFQGDIDPDSEESKQRAIRQRMQWYADGLEAFLRSSAPLWFFWGDKRWTRVFHGDPRYVRPLEEGSAASAPTPLAQAGDMP